MGSTATHTRGFDIYHDFVITATIAKVFDAIVSPAHLVNWWPDKCTGQPKLGASYNFYFTPEYDWWGEVVKIEDNKAFHIKMTKSDADWDPTSFGFDLERMGDQVQLRFWHVGWPACNAHFRRSSYCWAILLSGLKNYVEKGVVVPFEERE